MPILLQENFVVTAICRPGKPFSFPGVSTKVAAYDDLFNLTAALEGQDAIIEAFNPAAAASQSLIIKAAVSAGISHVITPDFSSDTFNEYVDELHIFQPKREAQQELERSGISWTAIITGPWYDWAIETDQFWINRKTHTITRFGSGNQKISMSRMAVNAEAAVAVLHSPEKYVNRPMYVASHTVSTNELIDIVNDVSTEAWRVRDVAVEGFAMEGKKQWDLDTNAGVKDRLASKEYQILGTSALFDEANRYNADFGDKLESGWDEGLATLKENIKNLLACPI